jgi:hypothetical protein
MSHKERSVNLAILAKGALNFLCSVKQQNEDGTTEKHRNVILPTLELGAGLRVSGPSITGQRFFVAPELGYVPAGRAPYTAVTFGVY